MSQVIKDSFMNLERHRQLLEENIEKLRQSLHHWQTWEAEYEGLKEEILAANLPADDPKDQLIQICQSYEGDLVNKTETAELLGRTQKRSLAQVVNLLDRRLDYVEQNVRTVQKQLETAENKLAAATVISTPEVRNDEGLPLTEIIEELDEDGNVISGKTSTPGDKKPQLLEVLQKAGVSNIPRSADTREAAKPLSGPAAPLPAKAIESKNIVSTSTPVRSKPAKKSVGFSSDTKHGPEREKTATAKKIEDIMAIAKRSEKSSEQPMIPTNESPEDSALRRQMLQYGLSEVGQVVAELELEEGSDWSNDEFDDEEETSDEEEDEYGRSTKPVVDERLHQRMRELEAKLGVKVMGNIGKPAGDLDTPVTEGIGRVTINGVEKPSSNQMADVDGANTKKAVRFSEDLDISPSVNPSTSASSPSKSTPPLTNVIERIAPEPHGRTVPTGPAGHTLAPQVLERESPLNPSAAEPDELDPQLLHQEVAVEYHKARNRMIQRQGGFAKEEESEIVQFTEEEGGPKKMSRFKAARLAKMGL